MKTLSTSVLFGLLWLGLSASAWAGEAGSKGIVFRKDVFLRGQDGYHTYRIPTMVVTSRGTVLLFCEGRKRSRRDGGDVDTLLKRSEDGGRTWLRQVLIHEEGGDGPIRVGNPCPIIERNGKVVHLLFTRGGGECLYYTKSTDEGKTWSKMVVTSDVPGEKEYTKTSFLKDFGGSPVRIGAGPVHGIQTNKGRLIAPSYVGRTVESKPRGQSGIIYSDDGGKTWAAGGLVPYVDELRHGECTVVQRPDGSLLMNMRTGGPGLYGIGYRTVSTSTDDGVTWSKPVVDKNLPGPGCQASMIRLNEKEILFLNPAVHRKGGFQIRSRRNLTLRLSRDEGRTWLHSRVLNEGLAGYSDMAVTKDGKILCVFENGTKDYCERISIVQVDRAWLAAGKVALAVAPGARAEKKAEKKLVEHFKALFGKFGQNSTTKVKIVSGPKDVKMKNGRVAGKQWIATSGKFRFKVTIQNSTKLKVEHVVQLLQKIPMPYMRACEVVSDEKEDGIAIYASLGGARAHGGKTYINLVPHADALVIAHEVGHALEQVAKESDPKILDKWEAAIKADKISVSAYGDRVRHEDLGDFAKVYAVCLDAGAEHLGRLKKLSPARFALWEQILHGAPTAAADAPGSARRTGRTSNGEVCNAAF